MRRAILAGCVVAVMVGVAGCDSAGERSVKTHAAVWRSSPRMMHGRAAHCVVATDEAIYAIAGTENGGPVMEVEKFDGAVWRIETRLPGEGLNAPAAVVMDEKIYVIGGFGTVTNVPTVEVRVYDTRKRTWSEGAPLPAPRGGHAAVVMDGKIHVIGGGNSQSTLAEHTEFDPATDRWSEKTQLPRKEGSPAAVVASGKLMAIGGRSGAKDYGDVFVYDAARDMWTEGPKIEPRATCGAVTIGNDVYVVGGESQARKSVLADVMVLKEGAKEWRAIEAMPTARSFARVVMFKGDMYVVGGSLEPQSNHAPRGTAVVERWTAASK